MLCVCVLFVFYFCCITASNHLYMRVRLLRVH